MDIEVIAGYTFIKTIATVLMILAPLAIFYHFIISSR